MGLSPQVHYSIIMNYIKSILVNTEQNQTVFDQFNENL